MADSRPRVGQGVQVESNDPSVVIRPNGIGGTWYVTRKENPRDTLAPIVAEVANFALASVLARHLQEK